MTSPGRTPAPQLRRPAVQHGWWRSEATVRSKLIRWVGECGSIAGARITLTDEKSGEQLAVWPDDA